MRNIAIRITTTITTTTFILIHRTHMPACKHTITVIRTYNIQRIVHHQQIYNHKRHTLLTIMMLGAEPCMVRDMTWSSLPCLDLAETGEVQLKPNKHVMARVMLLNFIFDVGCVKLSDLKYYEYTILGRSDLWKQSARFPANQAQRMHGFGSWVVRWILEMPYALQQWWVSAFF